MKKLILAALLAATPLAPVAASAATQASASAAQPYYSTSKSTIGELIENPATLAICKKYLPDVFGSEQIEQASGMTLKAIQQYSADTITDEKLAKIDEELKKVPPPKS